jgi:hypothetical protein
METKIELNGKNYNVSLEYDEIATSICFDDEFDKIHHQNNYFYTAGYELSDYNHFEGKFCPIDLNKFDHLYCSFYQDVTGETASSQLLSRTDCEIVCFRILASLLSIDFTSVESLVTTAHMDELASIFVDSGNWYKSLKDYVNDQLYNYFAYGSCDIPDDVLNIDFVYESVYCFFNKTNVCRTHIRNYLDGYFCLSIKDENGELYSTNTLGDSNSIKSALTFLLDDIDLIDDKDKDQFIDLVMIQI